MRGTSDIWMWLLVGTIAISQVGCFWFPDDEEPFPLEDEIESYRMPTLWPVVNLFEGQTGVSTAVEIQVRGVHWEFTQRLEAGTPVAASQVATLIAFGGDRPVQMTMSLDNIESGEVTLTPDEPLEPDTDYLLHFGGCFSELMEHMICPALGVAFSTRSAPRVLDLWRSDDTLVVRFSDAMDEDSLTLAHGSVDMVFTELEETYTVVTDLNVADFVIETDGDLLLLAPITAQSFKLVLGGDVRSATGHALDVDRDGGSDSDEVFVWSVEPELLPQCVTRADFPEPCIPDLGDWIWEQVWVESPIELETGI